MRSVIAIVIPASGRPGAPPPTPAPGSSGAIGAGGGDWALNAGPAAAIASYSAAQSAMVRAIGPG